MTQEEITTGNQLIAEFAGGHKYGISNMWTIGGHGLIHITEMKYHSSWDWIMPVVEKIESFGACIIIGRFFCEIKYQDPLHQDICFDVRIASGVKMNAVYSAVINFIEWYNQQNLNF